MRWAIILLPLLLAGCSIRFGGSKSVDAALSEVRARNAQLERELTQAQGERDQLAARLASLETASPASGPVSHLMSPQDLALATPTLVTLDFARSAGVDRRDPQAPRLLLDVVTTDGLGRFMQAVGALRVMASAGDQTVFDQTLSPVELRDAYRSSPLGTRYAIERPLAPEFASAPLTLRAWLYEPSGRTLLAERTLSGGQP